jgi:predicted phage baseplate assembly protein
MPLPLPNLDTRVFNELVDEGRSIIPGAAPAWTDFNYHDPGITLIDLFAWLVEQDIYSLNRISDQAYRSFLRVVGAQPRPAQVADTILTFSFWNPGSAVPASLPAGVQVSAPDGSLVFETTEGVNLSAANLIAVLSGANQALVDNSNQNLSAGKCYLPFGASPGVGNALYLGFDAPLLDQPAEVTLYLWAGGADADKAIRASLIEEWNAASKESEETCPREVARKVLDWRLHYGARTVWEYYAAPGVWTALSNVTDETRALTLSGHIRFTAPEKTQQMQGSPATATYAGDYFIRCRLTSGGFECPPLIRGIAINAIQAKNAALVSAPEALGTSNGRAQQVFQTQRKPVVAGSTAVQVTTLGNPPVNWSEELFWDRVGPHMTAYVLSPEMGLISFGDGRIGRVPPDLTTISATYRVGGGAPGNVASGTLQTPVAGTLAANLVPILKIAQPFAATGGADAEPLPGTMERAYTSLSQPVRGVTLSDFESLALATPAVPVARAFAIANYDPAVPCFPALGAVTVVVLPKCPDAKPQPSGGFLDAVERHIERWRTITTQVHVVGPIYTTVSVTARLNIEPGVDRQTVAQLAQTTLSDFLNPLHGGPDATGWPVGRGVYRSDILAMLNDLPGVIFVDELTLQADGGPAIGCDNIAACPQGLVASGQHQITANVWRSKR